MASIKQEEMEAKNLHVTEDHDCRRNRVIGKLIEFIKRGKN